MNIEQRPADIKRRLDELLFHQSDHPEGYFHKGCPKKCLTPAERAEWLELLDEQRMLLGQLTDTVQCWECLCSVTFPVQWDSMGDPPKEVIEELEKKGWYFEGTFLCPKCLAQ